MEPQNKDKRFNRTGWKIGGVVTSLLVIGIFLSMVGLKGRKKEAISAPAAMAPEVSVVTVTTQTIPDEPEFIGQTESSRPVEIRSQVAGIIKQRFFQEGGEVKQGERLYQIDPVPFQAALLSAKARVAQAEARLAQAKQNIDRFRPLLKDQAVSQKEVDDAAAEELASKAAMEAGRGDVVKAQFDLDNTLITAPISGLIERTRVYEGRLVSAQSDLLTVIDQVDPIYVTVNIPETYFLQKQREIAEKKISGTDMRRLRGKLILADGTTYSHEGKLNFADVIYKSDTGSRQGRFAFRNADRMLLPGQFVKLRIKGYIKPDAILLPQQAVQQGPQGSLVFVVGKDNQIEFRTVQASRWIGDQWLMEQGLRPGEQVVVAGLHRIRPGIPVKPVPMVTAKASPVGQSIESKKEDVR